MTIQSQQKNIFIATLPDIRNIKRLFSGDDSGIILFWQLYESHYKFYLCIILNCHNNHLLFI